MVSFFIVPLHFSICRNMETAERFFCVLESQMVLILLFLLTLAMAPFEKKQMPCLGSRSFRKAFGGRGGSWVGCPLTSLETPPTRPGPCDPMSAANPEAEPVLERLESSLQLTGSANEGLRKNTGQRKRAASQQGKIKDLKAGKSAMLNFIRPCPCPTVTRW